MGTASGDGHRMTTAKFFSGETIYLASGTRVSGVRIDVRNVSHADASGADPPGDRSALRERDVGTFSRAAGRLLFCAHGSSDCRRDVVRAAHPAADGRAPMDAPFTRRIDRTCERNCANRARAESGVALDS